MRSEEKHTRVDETSADKVVVSCTTLENEEHVQGSRLMRVVDLEATLRNVNIGQAKYIEVFGESLVVAEVVIGAGGITESDDGIVVCSYRWDLVGPLGRSINVLRLLRKASVKSWVKYVAMDCVSVNQNDKANLMSNLLGFSKLYRTHPVILAYNGADDISRPWIGSEVGMYATRQGVTSLDEIFVAPRFRGLGGWTNMYLKRGFVALIRKIRFREVPLTYIIWKLEQLRMMFFVLIFAIETVVVMSWIYVPISIAFRCKSGMPKWMRGFLVWFSGNDKDSALNLGFFFAIFTFVLDALTYVTCPTHVLIEWVKSGKMLFVPYIFIHELTKAVIIKERPTAFYGDVLYVSAQIILDASRGGNFDPFNPKLLELLENLGASTIGLGHWTCDRCRFQTFLFLLLVMKGFPNQLDIPDNVRSTTARLKTDSCYMNNQERRKIEKFLREKVPHLVEDEQKDMMEWASFYAEDESSICLTIDLESTITIDFYEDIDEIDASIIYIQEMEDNDPMAIASSTIELDAKGEVEYDFDNSRLRALVEIFQKIKTCPCNQCH